MKYNPDIHHRHSIRLQQYDYSTEGMYFVTICTKDRLPLLSRIEYILKEPKISLTQIGSIVENELLQTSNINLNINIHNYIIMPNHIHMIIEIDGIRAQSCAPTKSISSVIRGIKSSTSSKIGYSIWQRNYYEHIIRNEKEYCKILEYIKYNPLNWKEDQYNC